MINLIKSDEELSETQHELKHLCELYVDLLKKRKDLEQQIIDTKEAILSFANGENIETEHYTFKPIPEREINRAHYELVDGDGEDERYRKYYKTIYISEGLRVKEIKETD